jgi:hydroxymethylbilane synthase
VVGTRGSELARTQTEEALAPLRAAQPGLEIEVRVIRTAGDRDRRSSLSEIGGQGVFVRDIERALLDGAIDLAVHSLKDLPPRLAPGLEIGAVPPRADPRDALVSRDGLRLAQLPPGSRVGTSSARRRALLRHLRPDLQVVDVRGNVGTRIARVREGVLDAVVLAAAGLARLGRLAEAAELFEPALMLPAPGQGALALEVRSADSAAAQLIATLDDRVSHLCALAERAFLGRLGAGCSEPVGAYAAIADATIRLDAFIATPDGTSLQRAADEGPGADAAAVGERLAERLLAARERR